MSGLEIWQKQIIANLRDQVSEECPLNKPTLEKLFFLMREQKPHFENFEYLNDGAFSLVLKVRNTKIQKEVALKILDCTNNKLKSGIEALKQEYDMLKKFKYNQHIVQVYDCFYLYDDYYDDEDQDNLQQTEKNEEVRIKEEERRFEQDGIQQKDSQELEQNNSKIQRKIETFLILEMEICKHNLKDLFQEMVKNEAYSNSEFFERLKVDIAIQMLDGLNTLHSHNIIHRDIKPQNFLVDQESKVKICDLGFASQISQSKSFKSAKGTDMYFAPEAEKGESRIQSDLFSLGLVLLELDNLTLFENNWIKKQDLIDLYRGEGQLKKKINQNTKLYKIIEICLKPNYRERKSSSELLYNLIKNHELKFDIYSTIIESLLEKQVKEIIQFYNKDHQTKGRLPLSENDFIKVFQELFKKKKYQQNMTILGFGSFGIVLSTKSANDSENEVVIKIQKIQDQQIIENEIALMTKAQSQYIIKFYSSYYIEGIETEIQKDSQNFIQKEKYAVFELERCTCSLTDYLERQKKDGEITEEEKIIICKQILQAVNHIHSKNIIHNDIKPDNFLIILDQDKQNIQVRLCDFGLAIQLKQEEQIIEQEEMMGGIVYQSPESYHKNENDKRIYSKQSDTFAVGLILTLLDNYLNFYTTTTFYYPLLYVTMMNSQFSIPFDPQNDHFNHHQERINRQSPIYRYIQSFLKYDRQNRRSISDLLNNQESNQLTLNIQNISRN